MAIYKRCNFCGGLYQGDRCLKCAAKHSRKRREDNEALKLYNSAEWRKCRANVLLRYQGQDIWQLGAGKSGHITGKIVIHHILERDDRPDLFYDLDNLISVSVDSHAEIHAAYEKDRAGALKRIQRGIEVFKEGFDYGG